MRAPCESLVFGYNLTALEKSQILSRWLMLCFSASVIKAFTLIVIAAMSFTFDSPVSIYWIIGIVLVPIVLIYRLACGPKFLPLPPGPKPLPGIGNLHQLPKSRQWFELYKWSKEYGPIMYLNMAGQHFVVLSSNQAAQDLLTRRGAQYSYRPRRVMVLQNSFFKPGLQERNERIVIS